jgi:hypothetical protein
VLAQPISDLEWVHEKDASNTIGYAMLVDTTSSISEIHFTTGREFSEFLLTRNDDNAKTYMTSTLESIKIKGSSTDIKGQFDVSDSEIKWNGSGKMPIGEYTISFQHQFKSGAALGQEAYYKLDKTIQIETEDATGSDVTKTYTFPDAEINKLKFRKAFDVI